jgi:hypothetical protein
MSGCGLAAAIWTPISVRRSLRSLEMNLRPQQLSESTRMLEGEWLASEAMVKVASSAMDGR